MNLLYNFTFQTNHQHYQYKVILTFNYIRLRVLSSLANTQTLGRFLAIISKSVLCMMFLTNLDVKNASEIKFIKKPTYLVRVIAITFYYKL